MIEQFIELMTRHMSLEDAVVYGILILGFFAFVAWWTLYMGGDE